MGRPRLGDERMEKYTLMLAPKDLARVDALLARLQAQMPLGRLERAVVCREALLRGLAQMEAAVQPPTRPQRTRKAG